MTRENFGCGSSREHAPWALHDYGIRALVAPSFADIFYLNCFKNGMLPVTLPHEIVEQLFSQIAVQPSIRYVIDLEAQAVTPHGSAAVAFKIDCGSFDFCTAWIKLV